MTAASYSSHTFSPRLRPVARLERYLAVLAVCLPVPICAASGLSVPLPTTVERVAAGLVPWLDAVPLSANEALPIGARGSIVGAGSPETVAAGGAPQLAAVVVRGDRRANRLLDDLPRPGRTAGRRGSALERVRNDVVAARSPVPRAPADAHAPSSRPEPARTGGAAPEPTGSRAGTTERSPAPPTTGSNPAPPTTGSNPAPPPASQPPPAEPKPSPSPVETPKIVEDVVAPVTPVVEKIVDAPKQITPPTPPTLPTPPTAPTLPAPPTQPVTDLLPIPGR